MQSPAVPLMGSRKLAGSELLALAHDSRQSRCQLATSRAQQLRQGGGGQLVGSGVRDVDRHRLPKRKAYQS